MSQRTAPLKKSSFALIAAASLLVSASAVAAAVNVPNFSFEDFDIIDTGGGIQGTGAFHLDYWDKGHNFPPPFYYLYDPSDDLFPGTAGNNGLLPGTAHGTQTSAIRLVPTTAQGASGFLTSGILVQVQSNTTYTLTVAIGNSLLASQESERVDIRLLINGMVLVQASTTGNALVNGTFSDLSTSYTTLPSGDPFVGGVIQIQLAQTKVSTATNIDSHAFFDNVRLDATVVPEPMSVALFLSGAVFALRRIRNRP